MVMKKLKTHCPRCRASFYVDVEEEKKIPITCKNCNFRYQDTVDERRLKEVKYNWEVFDRISYRLKEKETRFTNLKIAGISLSGAIFLFLLGTLTLINIDDFTVYDKSILIASGVFSIFVLLGIINILNKKSFIVSFIGSIFALFGTITWNYLIEEIGLIGVGEDLSFLYLIIGLFLSFLTLGLVINNRDDFNYGY